MRTLIFPFFLVLLLSACDNQNTTPTTLKEVSAEQVEMMIKRLDMRIANTEDIFVPFIIELQSGYSYSAREGVQTAIERQLNLLGKIVAFDEGYAANDCADVKSTANAVVKRYQLLVGIDLHDCERSAMLPNSDKFNRLLKEKLQGIDEIKTQYEHERAALIKAFGLSI